MEIINKKYIKLNRLGSGSFGSIFKGQNIRTKEYVAIKIENKNEQLKSLKNEAKIYQHLGKIDGFGELKIFGTTNNINYLVITLLGNSLHNIINLYKTLCLKTVLLLGIQIFQRIRHFHNKSLLHRDLKPSNFIFGIGKDTNKLFLVDFGLAKRYDHNGKHIEVKKIKNIIGSPNFVSLNIHNNIEPSRRDDIESCIYIILTMLFGRLEWFDKNNFTEITNLKKNILNIDDIPFFIKQMLSYVRNMSFEETPNYDYLINLLVNEFKDNNLTNDEKFEWS
jgi:serine/threonine protein kinase